MSAIVLEKKIKQLQDEEGIDLLNEIWNAPIPNEKKINLSMQLADHETTYSILCNMWISYKIANIPFETASDRILDWYKTKLSENDSNYLDSIEYSLYFDILEEPILNVYAWKYFLTGETTHKFIKILLKNSGPVPYYLKDELFLQLIRQEEFHPAIYESIRHSCFDNCRQINRQKAKEHFLLLNLSAIPQEVKYPSQYHSIEKVKEYLEIRN